MAPWLILTGSELDDWIYWHLPLQSLLITINYCAIANIPTSQITRTSFILVLVLRCTPLYSYHSHFLCCTLALCPLITSRCGSHRKHVSHVTKNACLLVRYLIMNVLLLLRANFGNVFTETLPSIGHMRHNIYHRKNLKSHLRYRIFLEQLIILLRLNELSSFVDVEIFTDYHHLNTSWVNFYRNIYLGYALLLFLHLRRYFPWGFPTKQIIIQLLCHLSHEWHMSLLRRLLWCNHSNNIRWRIYILLVICYQIP
jgi:hypothetical protein